MLLGSRPRASLCFVLALAGACATPPPPAPLPDAPPAPRFGAPGEPLAPLPVARALTAPKDPATALAASQDVTCARLASGAVTCWGGTLSAPRRVAGWTDIVKIALDDTELCGLHRDGRVECGPPQADLRPIAGVTSAIDLAASGAAMCVLEKTGDVACRVGGPGVTRTRLHHATALAMGHLMDPDWQFPSVAFACALAGGSLACIDVYLQAQQDRRDPRKPIDRYLAAAGTAPKLWLGAPRVVQAGITELLPSDEDGRLCARAGSAAPACLALDPELRARPAGAGTPGCEVTETTVSCPFIGEPRVTVALDHVVQVTHDGAHACALDRAGAVACWGSDERGQLGRGAVAAAAEPAWGLDDAIDVVAWTNGVVALRGNGQLAYWGHGDAPSHLAPAPVPTTLSAIRDATRLVAGHFHACVLRKTGAVACWGLGSRLPFAPAAATDVAGLRDVRELAATDFGVLARTGDGTLLHVGDPQLGASASVTPAPIRGAERAAGLVVAGAWVCVLDRAPGPVRCWSETAKATSREVVAASDAVEIAGSGPAFPDPAAGATLIARLGDGRALRIALHLEGDQPVATAADLATDTRSLFTTRSVVCARGAHGTTCAGDAPPIPHAYDDAPALTAAAPTCAVTPAHRVVCFGLADPFMDGTGRSVSRVPVPVALE